MNPTPPQAPPETTHSGPRLQAVIRVMIVEDNPRQLMALSCLLSESPGFTCAGAHPCVESAERQLAQNRPDLILLDLEIPGRSGLEWLPSVNSRWPLLPVVAHTIHGDPGRLYGALEAGAVGYLQKPVPPVRLLESIRDAIDGGSPISPAIARILLRRFRTSARHRRDLQGLTPRELEILQLLSEGLLPEEVAIRLEVSPRTVTTHIQNTYRKLHVNTRAQAVARFVRGDGPAIG